MFGLMAARRAGLRVRYAETHRHYHGQAHVDALLRGLQDLQGRVASPHVLELAIWYHDAVYDPAARDNEARSAALLRAEMTGLVDAACLSAAVLMVERTADHLLPADLPDRQVVDCAYFLDLDLAILGAPPAEYDRYEADIAREYLPVFGADAYRTGRREFLRGQLGRARLFHTEMFHAALDGRARRNIRRALDAT